jgi:hypothetical protein
MRLLIAHIENEPVYGEAEAKDSDGKGGYNGGISLI